MRECAKWREEKKKNRFRSLVNHLVQLLCAMLMFILCPNAHARRERSPYDSIGVASVYFHTLVHTNSSAVAAAFFFHSPERKRNNNKISGLSYHRIKMVKKKNVLESRTFVPLCVDFFIHISYVLVRSGVHMCVRVFFVPISRAHFVFGVWVNEQLFAFSKWARVRGDEFWVKQIHHVPCSVWHKCNTRIPKHIHSLAV